MIQSLDVPVVSLAVPNIHKLNDITSDDLSCMWTVFTKCKDNLENGRRLENLSWRLWYRESLIEKAKEQPHVRTPIPIQHSNSPDDYFSYASSSSSSSTCSTPPTPRSLKHLSPSSFKRMISSLNTPIEPYTVAPPSSHKPNAIPVAPSAPLVEHPAENNSIVPPPSPPASAASQHQLLPHQAKPPPTAGTRASKFYVSDDDDDDDDDGDDEETVQGAVLSAVDKVDDDDGLWSTVRSADEGFVHGDGVVKHGVVKDGAARTPPSPSPKDAFQKQIPAKAAHAQPRQSLLTSMLASKPSTPMVRPRRVVHHRSPPPPHTRHPHHPHPHAPSAGNDTDLSQSLRYCVDWEQHQNVWTDAGGGGLESRVASQRSALATSYWESFRGW